MLPQLFAVVFLATEATLPGPTAESCGAFCWRDDGISAVQVEVVQNVRVDPVVSTGVIRSHLEGVEKPQIVRRANTSIDILPAPRPRPRGPGQPLPQGTEVVHTRGHLNSLIAIIIFSCLAILSICAYCCMIYQHEGQEAEVQGVKRGYASVIAEEHERLLQQAVDVRRHKVDADVVVEELPHQGSVPDARRRTSGSAMGPVPAEDVALMGDKNLRRSTWQATTKAWATSRWSPEEGEETMTDFAFIVNVVADLCPSGFLSIAYGMDGTGYVWAGVLLFIFYGLCVYTMWACGRTCEISGEADFASQWALVIGPGGAWVPLLIIIIVAFGALLCYACYFGDLLEEVMPALGLHLPRYSCLICFSLFPALPLCLLKNLSALACSSFFAVMALVYTAVVMCVRLADGSYGEAGHFYGTVSDKLKPALPEGANILTIGPKSLLFINILAMAFHCHCNACKYYRELKGNTPRHFRNVTTIAMGLAAILYAVVGFVGFRTFGTASHGTILKNYSMEDMPVNIARVLISLSLAASYAIMFSALREAFVGLLRHITLGNTFDLVWRQDVLSGVLVALVTTCGVISKDSGLVDGFVGAFCGNAIIYIIPCLLYVATVRSFLVKKRNQPGIIFSGFLVLLGVLLAVAGCISLVVFEVEADPPRRVRHHWGRVDPSQVLQPHDVADVGGKRPMIRNFTHNLHFGFRPRVRHIWAMR